MAALVATAALACDTQPRAPRPFIAYVGAWTAHTDPAFAKFVDALRRRQPQLLRDADLEYVAAEDDSRALEAAIRAVENRGPAVLVAPTADAAAAARVAAGPMPVVFASYLDPVRLGLVRSMRAPGGRLTGVSLADGLDVKRLEILRDAFPGLTRVGVLVDHSWGANTDGPQRVAEAAVRFGLATELLYADDPAGVERVMSSPQAAAFDAWYVPPTYVSYLAQDAIIARVRAARTPGMFGTTAEVAAGGLMAYAQDTAFAWDALAELVARVYAGEDPAGIPVETPRRYELALRAAPGETAVPIAPAVVRRADRVF